MSIALQPRSVASIRWSRPDTAITVGQRDGEYAGLVEQLGDRFIATDELGTIIGTFDSERTARAALEPASLARQIGQRARRDRTLAIATGAIALSSTVLALAGMLSLLA